MDKEHYINKILQGIHCSRAKKKEIRRQFETDIDARIEDGGSLESIMEDMGSAEEIANSFNDNLSDAEKKQYRSTRILKILLPIVLGVTVLFCLIYYCLPKTSNIASSKYFDQTELENTLMETIDLLDREDYSALQNNATPQMQPLLTKESIDAAKQYLADDFGARQSISTPYMAEIVQYGRHYCICEVTVSYDNTNVIYRITYNRDMQLTGLYIR